MQDVQKISSGYSPGFASRKQRPALFGHTAAWQPQQPVFGFPFQIVHSGHWVGGENIFRTPHRKSFGDPPLRPSTIGVSDNWGTTLQLFLFYFFDFHHYIFNLAFSVILLIASLPQQQIGTMNFDGIVHDGIFRFLQMGTIRFQGTNRHRMTSTK